jgi:hypothetical protein
LDGRFIPIPDIGRLAVGQSTLSTDHVRYPEHYGRIRVGLMYSGLSHA